MLLQFLRPINAVTKRLISIVLMFVSIDRLMRSRKTLTGRGQAGAANELFSRMLT